MNRVSWDSSPRESIPSSLPANLRETIFNYLPPPVPMTPIMEDLAFRYVNGQLAGKDLVAMTAAHFIQPYSEDLHRRRRQTFRLRVAEAEALGFVIPDIFREFVETDAYVDRVHHSNIWLEMPEELWRLPSDPSRLVFLAFVEGHAGCAWHLLLAPDGFHSMVFCEYPFGLPSNWPFRRVPDYRRWTVELCADSIEEWLYWYFLDTAEDYRLYIEQLRSYHPKGWSA